MVAGHVHHDHVSHQIVQNGRQQHVFLVLHSLSIVGIPRFVPEETSDLVLSLFLRLVCETELLKFNVMLLP